jgi:hypothetical protein
MHSPSWIAKFFWKRTDLVGAGFFLVAMILGVIFDPEFARRNKQGFPMWNSVIDAVRHPGRPGYMLVIIGFLLLLCLAPKRLQRWATEFNDATVQRNGIDLVFLIVPGVLVAISAPISPFAFIPMLTGCLLVLISALKPFFSEGGREHAIRAYDRLGLAGPTLFAAIVASYALILFAWTGLFLSMHGWVSISAPNGIKRSDFLFYLFAFAYEAAKAIPFLDISDAFHWVAPYDHSGPSAGIFIVLFRAAVLTPIIGYYGAYWNYLQSRRRKSKGELPAANRPTANLPSKPESIPAMRRPELN